MDGPKLDDRYAASLRMALVDTVRNDAKCRARRRWSPLLLSGGAALALAITGGGVAVATGLVSTGWLPGLDRDQNLAPASQTIQEGSTSISTSGAPQDTNGASITMTCIDPGTVMWPNGATMTCDAPAAGTKSRPAFQTVDIPRDGSPLKFDAPDGMRWGLELTWVKRTPTEFGVNARGETYGAVKDDGTEPDLIAAIATNGEQGYYRKSEFEATKGSPSSPADLEDWSRLPLRVIQIHVYASDGTTVIGSFNVMTQRAGE